MSNLIDEFPNEWEKIENESSEVIEDSENNDIEKGIEVEKEEERINPLNPCEGCKYEGNLNSCYSCINFKKE